MVRSGSPPRLPPAWIGDESFGGALWGQLTMGLEACHILARWTAPLSGTPTTRSRTCTRRASLRIWPPSRWTGPCWRLLPSRFRKRALWPTWGVGRVVSAKMVSPAGRVALRQRRASDACRDRRAASRAKSAGSAATTWSPSPTSPPWPSSTPGSMSGTGRTTGAGSASARAPSASTSPSRNPCCNRCRKTTSRPGGF